MLHPEDSALWYTVAGPVVSITHFVSGCALINGSRQPSPNLNFGRRLRRLHEIHYGPADGSYTSIPKKLSGVALSLKIGIFGNMFHFLVEQEH